VQGAVDELNAALAAQPHGGTAVTAEKRNKQEALITILRKLKHYVEDNCGNDARAVRISFRLRPIERPQNWGHLLCSPFLLESAEFLSVEIGD
jgi:hypothetical protein